MPSTAAANVGAAAAATSSSRRVTFKEDEADEEHNEDETIQVGVTFQQLRMNPIVGSQMIF